MSDQRKGGIAWTEMVDRGGRRVRVYKRTMPGPGKRARREMLASGLAWCRGCKGWVVAGEVRKGACRGCRNAEYRASYARGGRVAIVARVRARKRGVAAVDPFMVEVLLEQSGGLCVYCGENKATAFDHVVPVARGGVTKLGNVVPACTRCNSRKRCSDLDRFLPRCTPLDVLVDMIVMEDIV